MNAISEISPADGYGELYEEWLAREAKWNAWLAAKNEDLPGSKRKNARLAARDCGNMEVDEEATQRGKSTPPKHHQCDECKDFHAGSYCWNWTADWRWLCQSCWQRHQELQHQELRRQALEQAVQMPVPDDDTMDVNE